MWFSKFLELLDNAQRIIPLKPAKRRIIARFQANFNEFKNKKVCICRPLAATAGALFYQYFFG